MAKTAFTVLFGLTTLLVLLANSADATVVILSNNWNTNSIDGLSAYWQGSTPSDGSSSQLIASKFTVTGLAWNITAINVEMNTAGDIDTYVRFHSNSPSTGLPNGLIGGLTPFDSSCTANGLGYPSSCVLDLYRGLGSFDLVSGTYWVSWSTDVSPPTFYYSTTGAGVGSNLVAGLCGANFNGPCASPSITPKGAWQTVDNHYPLFQFVGTSIPKSPSPSPSASPSAPPSDSPSPSASPFPSQSPLGN